MRSPLAALALVCALLLGTPATFAQADDVKLRQHWP